MTINSQQSYMVLSKLSAGTSYIITVTATKGRAQSDILTSIVTTGRLSDNILSNLYVLVHQNSSSMYFLCSAVPAPPTHLKVTNVTDTKALLQWTPSLGKVDRFIISYESSRSELAIARNRPATLG